jgi:hypothetical protein
MIHPRDLPTACIASLFFLLIASALPVRPCSGQTQVFKVPDLHVQEQPATEAETVRIKGLIAKLAETKDPDIGYSMMLSDVGFAPTAPAGGATSAALKDLVALGAKAIPLLLEALTDSTPTGLKLTPENTSIFDRILPGGVPSNPANTAEVQLINSVDRRFAPGYFSFKGSGNGTTYTVTVGDLCYVAIGQITNRPYCALQFQPPGTLIITSPTGDDVAARKVQAVWGKKGLRQKLLESLLFDFSQRVTGGESFELGAAMRLLYYFPEQAGPVVLERLKQLDSTLADRAAANKRNGLAAEDFIAAIAFTQDKAIRTELLRLFKESPDPAILVSCLPALDLKDLAVLARLTDRLMAGGKVEDRGSVVLLKAVGDRFPDKARDIFTAYLKDNSVWRRAALCAALRTTRPELAAELLAPLLADKRPIGGHRFMESELPVRVCDEAAITLCQLNPELTFSPTPPQENVDRQIEVIQKKIEAASKSKP